MAVLPVLILILLVPVAYWISLPLLVVGLFFGCKYRFSGPDLGKNQVGEVVNQVPTRVGDAMGQVRDEFRREFDKSRGKKGKQGTREMAERIPLVKDGERPARMVELELQYERYEVEKAFDGCAGLDRVLSGEFDLVPLDIMLPALSGVEALRRLRRGSIMFVIMLTAWDTVTDKVSGLDMETDDYIIEPLTIGEPLTRIQAALRKRPAQVVKPPRSLLAAGPLTTDTDWHEVNVNGEGVKLTRRKFDLLYCPLENKEWVISRESLPDHVWGFDSVRETSTVDIYICFLRVKIDEHFGIKLIRTARGVGYVIQEGGQ